MSEQSIQFVLGTVWMIFPAYMANGMPLLLGGVPRHAVDNGRRLPDGERIFGDGKTVEGLVVGITFGVLTGLAEGAITGSLKFYLLAGLTLGTGAMLGDLIGSFIKRRLKMRWGKPLPLMDQLSFLAGALLLYGFLNWPTLPQLAVLITATLTLHVSTNLFAFIFGLKHVPW